MSEKKKKKVPRARTERRFLPEATHTSWLAAGLGMAGSLALGAGVWGQWLMESPPRYAPYLVTAGAAGLGGGLWLGNATTFPVRAGDAGIAIERGSEVTRLLWCDMDGIELSGGNLVAKSPSLTLSIPVGAHPKATAFIAAEAQRRLPKLLKGDEAAWKSLATGADSSGEETPITGDQVAGRRCAATKKIISFERDARLCQNCGQVYHKDNVPQKCLTCDADLAGRTAQA
jgi:hypothetical protein